MSGFGAPARTATPISERREIDPALDAHLALFDERAERVARHDDDIDRLAARQALWNCLRRRSHRGTPFRHDRVAAGALVGGKKRAIGGGEAARTHDAQLRRLRRARRQERCQGKRKEIMANGLHELHQSPPYPDR